MKSNWIVEKRKADKRVQFMMKDNISHHSCTICPAPKNIERGEIESIYEAVKYYKQNGVKAIIAQPKFMGSYLACYIRKDINESTFFSRGGYKIPEFKVPKAKLIELITPLHSKLIKEDITEVLIEAELMTWAALGKGLIEREFSNYLNLHSDHLNYLKETDLLHKINLVYGGCNYFEYKSEGTTKSHIKRQYEALERLVRITPNIKDYENSINLYAQQLEKYGSDTSIYLEPFNIVYKERLNGDREFCNNDSYMEVSEQPYSYTNLADVSLDEAADFIYLFRKLYAYDIEGIMIKPEQSRLENVIHAFKVRNNEYLQLIYGMNFDRNYGYYLEKRNINRKFKASLEDYKIHCALSQAKTLEEKKSLYYKTIDAENFQKDIDTRL